MSRVYRAYRGNGRSCEHEGERMSAKAPTIVCMEWAQSAALLTWRGAPSSRGASPGRRDRRRRRRGWRERPHGRPKWCGERGGPGHAADPGLTSVLPCGDWRIVLCFAVWWELPTDSEISGRVSGSDL